MVAMVEEWKAKLRARSLALLALTAFSACSPHKSISPPQERFSGPWIEADERVQTSGAITNQELGLQRALVTHHVDNCSQYFYRQAVDDDSTFLVYCRVDGPVSAYIVTVSSYGEKPDSPPPDHAANPDADGTVLGPMQPYLKIPFPAFCCSEDSNPPPKAGSFPNNSS